MPETINVCVFCGAIVSPRGQNENQNRLCEGAFGMAAEKSGAGELGELPPGLAGLVAQAGHAAKARPVERWDPPYCGEIDMRIAAMAHGITGAALSPGKRWCAFSRPSCGASRTAVTFS
jgi:hypothetical protein